MERNRLQILKSRSLDENCVFRTVTPSHFSSQELSRLCPHNACDLQGHDSIANSTEYEMMRRLSLQEYTFMPQVPQMYAPLSPCSPSAGSPPPTSARFHLYTLTNYRPSCSHWRRYSVCPYTGASW